MDPRQWNLKKAKQFQRKLNELPQDVTLVFKFCLTFQIQDFEVSLFVVSKCQFFKEFLSKALNSGGLFRVQNHLLLTHVRGASQKQRFFKAN